MMEPVIIDKQSGLPIEFNVKIIDYASTKVWCKGIFIKASEEERSRYPMNKPIAFFENTEPHGWGIAFYSVQEIVDFIRYHSDSPLSHTSLQMEIKNLNP